MTSPALPDAERLFPVVPALPPDAVLLHVGVHKTGTTAIQAALADARPELRRAGVLYPGKRKAQHRSAMAVTQRTWDLSETEMSMMMLMMVITRWVKLSAELLPDRRLFFVVVLRCVAA